MPPPESEQDDAHFENPQVLSSDDSSVEFVPNEDDIGVKLKRRAFIYDHFPRIPVEAFLTQISVPDITFIPMESIQVHDLVDMYQSSSSKPSDHELMVTIRLYLNPILYQRNVLQLSERGILNQDVHVELF